jgi:imidazolonepropionase-like amidohydrolase
VYMTELPTIPQINTHKNHILDPMKYFEFRLLRLCLVFFAVSLNVMSNQALAQLDTTKYALVGGLLIDGSGAEPVRNSIVLINGNRIEAVGTIGRLAVPEDYQLVSTEGMTLMPGLWDPHVHLLYSGHPDFSHWFATYSDQFANVTIPASAHQILMAGVTSVRDLAVNTRDIARVRQRIEEGELPGPTIYAAGAALMPIDVLQTMPHIIPIDNDRKAVNETKRLIADGMDFIKILGAVPESQNIVNAIVRTAHAAGIRVTAHGRNDDEIRVALIAGVDEIQHIGVDTPTFPEDILDLIEQRIASGIPLYWNPTVGMILNTDELAADPEWLDDPKNFLDLPADMELDIRQAIARANFNVQPRSASDTIKRKLQSLSERGVIMVFGSDEGSFGHPASESTWRELETWVFELGMSPLVAIKWATSDAAEYMGVGDEVGTITPGKLADIITVTGSPLRHFSTLREPAMVFKNGVRVR